MAAIAAQARVSVETIYKGFGGKPGLVRAIVERGLAGAAPVPAEQRSDQIRDTEPDPRRILTAWGAFVTEIAPRAAPILLLASEAAASDPELAALLDEVSAARLERMTVNARALSDAGHLRPGITVAQAADILWTYSSPRTVRPARAPPRMVTRPLRPFHGSGHDRRPAPAHRTRTNRASR